MYSADPRRPRSAWLVCPPRRNKCGVAVGPASHRQPLTSWTWMTLRFGAPTAARAGRAGYSSFCLGKGQNIEISRIYSKSMKTSVTK